MKKVAAGGNIYNLENLFKMLLGGNLFT